MTLKTIIEQFPPLSVDELVTGINNFPQYNIAMKKEFLAKLSNTTLCSMLIGEKALHIIEQGIWEMMRPLLTTSVKFFAPQKK